MKLDNADRFDAVAGVPTFATLCEEQDNQLRNASHHGDLRMDRKAQTIRYRQGKGGIGPQQPIDYAAYLARSSKLFLKAMTLLRHASEAKPPLV